ncbi:MAG TPA: hypothetical protein DCZ02_00900 [Ruminococcaceae bacterium]|nr:hypothetical protein [Oscillospiraceae bacterium]
MINIVPKPYYIMERQGCKILDSDSKVCVAPQLEKSINAFSDTFDFIDKKNYKFSIDCDCDCDVKITYNDKLKDECYNIECTEKCLTISTSSYAGLLYATMSLKQMVFFALEGSDKEIQVPCVDIQDEPRFGYRGVQIDEARHFIGAENLKKILRLMSLYKLNTLHWHLTDDQGWRIEIKKYPLLTEVGSKRKDTNIHGWQSTDMVGKPYEGYYTQEQIKDIVEYAKKLNITIVPEIDMPAHFAAAMASYNWLGCREVPCEVHWFFGGKVPLSIDWKDWNRSACAGKESTYEFIFNVIDEVTELFPGKYFHIGGDEAPKDEWKKCPHCQKRMKENGLKNVEDLQGYFNNRIANHLREKGKTLIVWNEALEANNLDESVVGQYWTPQYDPNVKKELKKGRKMIISKHQAFYFDMCYCQYPLADTYNFEPTDKIVPTECEDQILGLEGHCWSEWIADFKKLEMQLFPRALALSEDAWSCKYDKNLKDFNLRLPYQERILDCLDVNYAENEVANPKGYFHRKTEMAKWATCDQYREVRKNAELKKKKM